jgi:hypothetical protein
MIDDVFQGKARRPADEALDIRLFHAAPNQRHPARQTMAVDE